MTKQSNIPNLIRSLEAAKRRILTATGEKAVEMITKNMEVGYGNPIWKTGNLQGDVQFQFSQDDDTTIEVGNTVEYAPHVHDGTYKMAARPYIRDAILSDFGIEVLEETITE